MNRDVLEVKRKQLRGENRETWGEITDDEIDKLAGKRDQLAGVLQEKYGWNREEAERHIDEFMTRHNVTDRV